MAPLRHVLSVSTQALLSAFLKLK